MVGRPDRIKPMYFAWWMVVEKGQANNKIKNIYDSYSWFKFVYSGLMQP